MALSTGAIVALIIGILAIGAIFVWFSSRKGRAAGEHHGAENHDGADIEANKEHVHTSTHHAGMKPEGSRSEIEREHIIENLEHTVEESDGNGKPHAAPRHHVTVTARPTSHDKKRHKPQKPGL